LAANFKELLPLIRGGGPTGEEAMTVVLHRFGGALRRMAQRMIGRPMQAHVDGDDLLQSVIITLWLGLRTGKFTLAGERELMGLAKVLLRREVAQRWRRLRLEMNATVEFRFGDTVTDQALPPVYIEPDRPAGFLDMVEHFLHKLAPADRRLIRMRLAGHSTADVARRLGADAAGLRMRLTRLRRRLTLLRKEVRDVP
jgi:DNA-directed RNA polymerase specialized sigma24 family protein